MNILSAEDKMFKVLTRIDEQFKLAPQGGTIQFYNTEVVKISQNEVKLIIDKFTDELNLIEKVKDWEFGYKSIFCQIKQKADFDKRYVEFVKNYQRKIKIHQNSLEKQIKIIQSPKTEIDKTIFKLQYKSNKVQLVTKHITYTIKKLGEGKQRNVFEYIYNHPNELITKDSIEANSHITFEDGDRLDQLMRNTFKSKELVKLLFPICGTNEIKIRLEFTSDDIKELGFEHLNI